MKPPGCSFADLRRVIQSSGVDGAALRSQRPTASSFIKSPANPETRSSPLQEFLPCTNWRRCGYWAALRTVILSVSISLPVMAQTATVLAPKHTAGPSTDTPAPEPTRSVIYQPFYVPSACDFGSSFPAGGASEARASMLDKKGPQVPSVFTMSAFSVMGFVKGTWPIVFDYFLEQDSLLIVVIAPEGSDPIIYRLDGKKGHWQSRLNLPEQLGNEPQVAHYTIRALEENLGPISPTHLHVHGIAAGPKAVGSIGIDQVNFTPATIRPARGERARYLFHSISDFKNVEVDFVRLALFKGQIIAARVGGKPVGGISKNAEKEGDWDGKSDGGGKAAKSYSPELQQWLRAPQGQHLVQVRAWWGSKDGGDWVTALSDNYVAVE